MRPSRDATMLKMACVLAERGECVRRKVGCIIADWRGRILSTGYNGLAPGQTPCTSHPCPGSELPSGTGLDICQASHAEISALITLEKPFEAEIIYCTTAPCISCTKALLLTSISKVVYLYNYPQSGKELWENDGRTWRQYDGEDLL